MNGKNAIYYAHVVDNSGLEKGRAEAKKAWDQMEKDAVATGAKIGNVFDEALQSSDDFIESIRTQKNEIRELEEELKRVQKTAEKTYPGREKLGLLKEINKIKDDLQAEKKALVELEIAYDKHKQSQKSLRTEIYLVREEMAKLTLEGKKGSDEYRRLEQELERLGTAYREVQAEQKLLTHGGKQIAGLVSGMQLLMGGFSVGQGIVSLFVKDNEKLVEIQTRLQAVMSILIGLQSISNTLHQTSAFRITTLGKITNLWAVAQTRVTAALGGSVVAAKLLMGALTLGLSVAVGAIITGLNRWSKKQDEIKKKQDELRRNKEEFYQSVGNSAAKTIVSIQKMSNEWNKLGDDLKGKEAYIKNNADEFKQLGVEISTVKDAENLLVNNTSAFIQSVIKKAQAVAAMDIAAEKYKEAIQKMLQAGGVNEEDRTKASDDWLEENLKGLDGDEFIKAFFDTAEKRNKEIEAKAERYAHERIGIAGLIEEGNRAIVMGLGFDAEAKALFKNAGITNTIDKSIVDAQKALAKLILDGGTVLQQSRINALKDGKKKELAQIDLNHKQELAKIEQDRKELEDAYKKAGEDSLTDADKVAFTERISNANQMRATSIDNTEKKYADNVAAVYRQLADVFLTEEQRKQAGVKKTYDDLRKEWEKAFEAGDIGAGEYIYLQYVIDEAETQASLAGSLEQFKTFEDKILETKKEYDDKAKTLRDAGYEAEAQEAEKQRDKEISSLNRKQIEESGIWMKLMGDVGKLSTETLVELFEQAKVLISESTSLSAADMEALMNMFDKVEKDVVRRNPFKTLKKSLKEYSDARKAEDKDGKKKDNVAAAAKNVQDAIKQVRTDVNDITGSFTGMLESFSIEIPDAVKGALQGVDEILGGLESIDLTKPMSIVTGLMKTLGGIGKTIGSIFGFGGGKKELSQKTIDTYNTFISTVDKLIAKQKELLAELSGKAAVDQSKKSQELLEKQTKYSQQILKDYLNTGQSSGSHSYGVRQMRALKRYREELKGIGIDYNELGGRADGLAKLTADQIRELQGLPEVWGVLREDVRKYLEDIVDADDKIKDILQTEKEAVTGLTFDEAKNSLDSLLLSADVTMEQISDNFEDYMRNAILRLYKTKILSNALEGWYDDFYSRLEDNTLDENDVNALRNQYENIYKDAQDKINEMLEVAGLSLEDESSREAVTKGIATASQDSVDELNGRFTVMQQHTFDLRENSNFLVEQSKLVMEQWRSLQQHNAQVLRHLSGIEGNTNPIPRMASQIDDIATRGVKIRTE